MNAHYCIWCRYCYVQVDGWKRAVSVSEAEFVDACLSVWSVSVEVSFQNQEKKGHACEVQTKRELRDKRMLTINSGNPRA